MTTAGGLGLINFAGSAGYGGGAMTSAFTTSNAGASTNGNVRASADLRLRRRQRCGVRHAHALSASTSVAPLPALPLLATVRKNDRMQLVGTGQGAEHEALPLRRRSVRRRAWERYSRRDRSANGNSQIVALCDERRCSRCSPAAMARAHRAHGGQGAGPADRPNQAAGAGGAADKTPARRPITRPISRKCERPRNSPVPRSSARRRRKFSKPVCS